MPPKLRRQPLDLRSQSIEPRADDAKVRDGEACNRPNQDVKSAGGRMP
jgi:hypothetical protein